MSKILDLAAAFEVRTGKTLESVREAQPKQPVNTIEYQWGCIGRVQVEFVVKEALLGLTRLPLPDQQAILGILIAELTVPGHELIVHNEIGKRGIRVVRLVNNICEKTGESIKRLLVTN